MRLFLAAAAAALMLGILLPASRVADATAPQSCWGQATKVFAQMGEMGEHASDQEEPRLGLPNLARALFEAGVLPDDSLQSLGAFVAAELGLSIDECNGDAAVGPAAPHGPPNPLPGHGAGAQGVAAAQAHSRGR